MKFLSLFLVFLSVNIYAQSTDCQELTMFKPDTLNGKNTFRMQTFMTSDLGKMENKIDADAAKNIKISIKSTMGMLMETETIIMDGIMYTKEKGDTVWAYKDMPKQELKQPPIPQLEQCQKVGSEVLDGRNFEIIEAKANIKELQMQGFNALQTMRIWVDRLHKIIKKMEMSIKNDKMQMTVTTEYGISVTIEKPKNAIPDSLKPKPKTWEQRKLNTPPFADYKRDSTGFKNTIPSDFAEYKDGPKALFHFISTNLVYPQAAKDAKKEGIVFLGFMVEVDGTISEIKVKRGIGYGCDEAAIEVIKKTSGHWQPVLSNGMPIRSPYTMPISFKL